MFLYFHQMFECLTIFWWEKNFVFISFTWKTIYFSGLISCFYCSHEHKISFRIAESRLVSRKDTGFSNHSWDETRQSSKKSKMFITCLGQRVELFQMFRTNRIVTCDESSYGLDTSPVINCAPNSWLNNFNAFITKCFIKH
jgi:hypothetical protein